jgi:hypothetical protein
LIKSLVDQVSQLQQEIKEKDDRILLLGRDNERLQREKLDLKEPAEFEQPQVPPTQHNGYDYGSSFCQTLQNSNETFTFEWLPDATEVDYAISNQAETINELDLTCSGSMFDEFGFQTNETLDNGVP